MEELLEELRELNAKPHHALTAWIKTIQQATLIQLNPADEWREDEGLIQLRRMCVDDLDQVDLPTPEHAYESILDVIKLPMEIPVERESPAPQFLFIRPDDYELFRCLQGRRWCILTGNSGISKSWFQWKFILFCYRPDLYHQFSFTIEQEPTQDEAPPKKRKVQEGSSWIPHLIVQTIGGEKLYLFFVHRPHDVLYLQHNPMALERLTDKNSVIYR